MTKASRDDITAITSRMDAAIVVIIELMAEAHQINIPETREKYTLMYDKLAKKYRDLSTVTLNDYKKEVNDEKKSTGW